jgi:aldehyde dehydrogenase (NAD+)
VRVPSMTTETAVPAVPLFVAGGWSPARSGATFEATSPSTGERIALIARGDRADASRAIEAATDAAPGWAARSAFDRAAALDRIARIIEARRDDLARTLTLDQGKPLHAEAYDEVDELVRYFAMAAADTTRLDGRLMPSMDAGKRVLVYRVPLGVVGVITPWNFPIAIPAWKIAPALAYGNTVVIKPADLVPGSTWSLVDILARAGLPAGVLNLVMGRGSVVGQTMLDSADIDAITFTGSVTTGRKVAEASVKHMRKFQLEMGGKNPLVVLDDADLEVAVEVAANGSYFQTGQRCTASSRLVVAAGIHDSFVAALTERIRGLVVDDACKQGTHMGPVVDPTQLSQDEDYIRIGKEEGATLAWGGERLNRQTPGYYLQPALFTDSSPDMRINREEIFGPVASVIRVSDYDEALAVANDTPFGLTSGICTTSLRYADHFRRNSQAGMVMINLPTAGVDYHVPFGGRKGSSYGPREQGRYAAEFFTSVKTTYTQP